jgi:hypothetical protein
MDDLEFYRQVNEIETTVVRIHKALIDTLIEHLPADKSPDYQGSVLLSVTNHFNKSVESVLSRLGVVEVRLVDAESVRKAEEIVKLEKDFYKAEPPKDKP